VLLDYLACWLCLYLQCLTPIAYLPVLECSCLFFTAGLALLWRFKGLMLGVFIVLILALLGLLMCVLGSLGVWMPA